MIIAEMFVLLKCLSNFRRTIGMPLIDCEINLILTWSANCVVSEGDGASNFAITGTKPNVAVVTLSTNDNAKLLRQLKLGLKRTINWNKYQLKVRIQLSNPHLDYLIDPRFEGVNKIFVLSFENNDDRTGHTGYVLTKVEIKDYSIMIDSKNFFDQPVKSDMKTNDNIEKIGTSKEDDYTTGCLLDYLYFKQHYKIYINRFKQITST